MVFSVCSFSPIARRAIVIAIVLSPLASFGQKIPSEVEEVPHLRWQRRLPKGGPGGPSGGPPPPPPTPPPVPPPSCQLSTGCFRCTGSDYIPCQSDAECNANQKVCNKGDNAGNSCSVDTDCPPNSGSTKKQGACVDAPAETCTVAALCPGYNPTFVDCGAGRPACGAVVGRYTRDQAKSAIDSYLEPVAGGAFGYSVSGLEGEVDSLVDYGVEIRKICASCDEFTPDPSTCYEDFCSSEDYGSGATHSGLLVLPLVEDTGSWVLRSGLLKGSVWAHPTIANTCDAPSQAFNDQNPGYLAGTTAPSDLNVIIAMLMGSNGHVTIAPDNMGFGESYDVHKGYIVKKAYQTSSVPLYLKAQKILFDETGCATQLANSAVVSGYSEGGFSATATAQALECMDVDIIKLNAGAGPYKVASQLVLRGHEDILNQVYPAERLYYLILFSAAYSGTNDDQANFGTLGETMASDSWCTNSVAYTRNDAISLTTEGNGGGDMNAIIPQYPNNPLDVFIENFDSFLTRALNENDNDPCRNPNRDKTGVEKLCEALIENDLQDYIASITYDVELCHNPADEAVAIENVRPEFDNIWHDTTCGLFDLGCENDHDGSGLTCIRRFLNYLESAAFTGFVATQNDYCS